MTKKTKKKENARLALIISGIILVGLGTFLILPYGAKLAIKKGNQNFNQQVYDLATAEKWYKIASVLVPNYSQVHYQLGRVYFVENKLDKAIWEFDKTLEANPEHKRTYYMRGLAKGYKKDYAGAQADFQSFIGNFPDEWAGYVDLAWVYYEDEQYEKARDIAEKGLALFPENAWVMKGLGVAYLELDEKDKAREILEKASVNAEKLTVKDWQLAYPGNDPSGAETNLAVFKNDIQEAIFSSKSVLAMEKPKYTSACAASSINICSGTSCVPWAYCDSDTTYHSATNLLYLTYGMTSYLGAEQLCSELTPPAPRCYSDADCCTPNCSAHGSYCIGSTFSDGCGGLCPGTAICSLNPPVVFGGICDANGLITMNWSPAPGAHHYYLSINNQSDITPWYAPPHDLSTPVPGLSRLHPGVPGHTYFNMIQSCNPANVCGSPSATWLTCRPPAPAIVNGSCNTYGSVVFNWSAATGATYYELKVSNQSDPFLFPHTPPDRIINTPATAQLYGGIPGQVYVGWVRACNAGGCGNDSAYAQVSCPRRPLVLTAPCDSSTSVIDINWSIEPSATAGYALRVDDLFDVWPTLPLLGRDFMGDVVPTANHTYSYAGLPGRSYSIWVQSKNMYGYSPATSILTTCGAPCGGSVPPGSTACLGDGTSATGIPSWHDVTLTGGCTGAECEYYTPTCTPGNLCVPNCGSLCGVQPKLCTLNPPGCPGGCDLDPCAGETSDCGPCPSINSSDWREVAP